MSSTRRLSERLERSPIIVAPGAHDAITAKLAVRSGFETLYVSGSGVSTALTGLPDVGLITLSEVAKTTHYISEAVPGVPLIVDADTGHGNVLNVMRCVRELERAGAAAIQIEDQEFPKRCGHLDGKTLVPVEEMAGKVKAAVEARTDPDFKIIARTDAKAIEGLDRAIERANRYLEAGADIIFIEALQSEEEFRAAGKAVDAPLLANMTEFGKTPYYTAAQFEDWGYKIVIFPVSALRIANQVIVDFFETLRKTGTQEAFVPKMLTRQKLYEIIDYTRYETYQERFVPKQ